ncbi:AI-2E family transporter [Ammonicoccus fulvus]|uniref:AI-2E family transporter n=1 Tax=Ammonicoccus fulvus TaxID=3138240 RepID=A0ABZ3FMS9_9ACTN
MSDTPREDGVTAPGDPAPAQAGPSLPAQAPPPVPAPAAQQPGVRSRRTRLISLLKRSVSQQPGEAALPTTPPPPSDEPEHDYRLLRMSPFSIGFFGALGALVAVTLVSMLMAVQSILVLVLLSLFLALGLNPAVEALTRAGLRRALSVLVVALTLLVVIGLAGWAVVPVFTAQINTLIATAPDLLVQLRDNPQIAELDARYGIIQRLNEALTSQGLINAIFGGLLGAGRLLANVVFSVIVTLVLTLYFLASLPSIKQVIYNLAPASRRPRVTYLADQMFRRIGGYLSGMFLVVTTAGTASFIFMSIVGLGEYALALAVMVALFAFIPLVGSNLSMVLVALVALTVSPVAAVATIVYFLIYQQFEAYVIQPRVMKRQVDVPGAVVIVTALAGGTLLGIVGALMAIPTAAALLLLYREVLQPKLDRT